GGMLRYGIPAYRLPKELLDKEIDIIRKMGVEIKTRVEFGKDVTVEELKAQGYKAFFVGIGAQYDTTMGIPGEDANGSFRSIEFLRDFSLGKLPKIGDICAVVGGGNTAMDVCRTLVRLGAKEVHIIYRRNKDAMPADPVEIREAEEEGVIFDFLRHPQEVILDENGLAKGVKLIKMELGEPDSSGRRRPLPVEGSEYIMELDAIVTAIGQKVDSDIVSYFSGMNTDKKGRILIEEDSMLTSVDGVFAGGDCVLGPSTVVESIATGRNAAEAIIRYLEDGAVSGKPFEFFINKEDFRPVTPEDFAGEEKKSAQKLKHISPDVRKKNFDAYEFTLTEEQVKQEAMRCMQCGCQELFDCKLKEYCTTYEIQKDRYAGTFKDLVRDTSHPYMEINFNKCILCGRCVRVCEELVGVNALGYINRGFPTQIGPRTDSDFFHSPDCISCGECADTCPTGAIASLPDTCQPGPHTLTHYKTVCANCDLGCEVL
ncbi:FAD-dependent oxidoreductase, partial [bacterium]|nr:FAD-dependent oxidoreductase [bacterium]